jgi:hypothetical protein
MSFLLSLTLSLQQSWRTRGWNRFCLEVGCGREWGGKAGGGKKCVPMYVNMKMIKEKKKYRESFGRVFHFPKNYCFLVMQPFSQY